MPEIALTGGIGSGKSTVADGLVARGAVLIDADHIVRELQQPGHPVFDAMVERMGKRIVAADGTLDRSKVADIVFRNATELEALNGLVHPAVADEMTARRKAHRGTGALVVLDIPLLVQANGEPIKPSYADLDGVVVVDVDAEIAVARLMEARGFSDDDARSRVANQASREARLAVADFVIDNSGTFEELETQIDACWEWAAGLAETQ